jgi:hypothetical protein
MYSQYINKHILKAAFFAAFFCLIFTSQAVAALPENIAVLPIKGEGSPEDLKELRVTFFNHIGSKNYRDMELADVDAKLFLLEQQTGQKWSELPHKQIADHLGVDGLVLLNVVGIEKIYAGVYGSLTVKLEVIFEEASTGRIIWKKENKVDRKSGGVPLSPWSAISTAVQSALVLRDSVKIELFDKLCRNIANELPEPDSLTTVRPPTIFSVVTNTLDSPFKAHEEILVSMKGDEGMKAYFSIVGQTDAVTLNEMKSGEYLGKYVIPEGVNYKAALVEVFLVNSEKRTVSKYQVPYLLTVDTTPPGEPANFRSGVSENGLRLSWDKPADEDIKEFVIKKAVEGETEYTDLAVTEISEYIDTNVTYGQKVFYKIFTRDLADNESKPVELTRMSVKPGPTDVSGELKVDTVFYSYGSPYIVRDELTVPKGVTLSIEAGSVVRFEDGASLTVLGRINAVGTKEENVTFKGKGYNITLHDTGAGGGKFENVFFRNGGIFQVSNSDVSIDGCRFESFDIALKSTDNSNIALKDSVFGYNKTALLGESGNISCDGLEFSHNSEALSFYSDVKSIMGRLVMKNNALDITTESDIFIENIDIPEKESYEVIRGMRGPIDVKYITPHRKSLSMLKTDSDNDLMANLAEELIKEKYEDAVKLFALVKELFPERYESVKAVEGYALYRLGQQSEGKELINSSGAPYAAKMAESLGLAEQTGPAAKLKFVGIRIPVIGTGEGLAKIALNKAVMQSVKDHVDSITGKLPRKKSFIVKDKILSSSDKYATGVYPVGTRVNGARFEGLYVVFLNTGQVVADLQDLRIIGDKKRELKIGIASCGEGDVTRPTMAKELNTLLFPVAELPSKGCTFDGYKEDMQMNGIDLLVIVKETADSSKSRVSQNLKMINADMGIEVYDAKDGTRLFGDSKGLVVYHMNENMGTKAAMQQAFDAIGQGVLDKLVEIERKRFPAPAVEVAQADVKQSAKASSAAVKQPPKKEQKKPVPKAEDKGIILSVAGVEPVFANMPEEFIDRPFMTLVIENQSDENIMKSELTLDVPGYFTSPISAELESIPALDRVRIQLFAEFTDELKKISKTKRTDAVISIAYGKKKAEIKYPIVIFDAHTTRWNTGEKLAIYIDSAAPVVASIADELKAEAEGLTSDKQLMKLYKGMTALDYLNGLGVKYIPDEKRPFTDVYGSNTKVDSAQYPAELLTGKQGDGDDILITYGSILKASGIDMAFTVSDGKVLALFDTSIPEEMLGRLGFSKEQVVVYDENIWIPIDVSAISDGSVKAWESGAKIASGLGDDTKLVILSKAMDKYKPAELFRSDAKVVPVSTFHSKYEELKAQFTK